MSIPVRLEPIEARLQRSDHSLAAIACNKPVGVRHSAPCELGGKDESLAPPFQQRAEKLFGLPELVDIRRVDEVPASFGIGVEDRLAHVGIGTVPPAGAEIAGAKCELRDSQTGTSEHCVFHGVYLSFNRA
jgi:hypothetical protein